MAPPPAPPEGLGTWAAARKWDPTGASALRGEAQERRCDNTRPECKSHTVTPASAPEHTTTTSVTVASLLHPPTASHGRPPPFRAKFTLRKPLLNPLITHPTIPSSLDRKPTPLPACTVNAIYSTEESTFRLFFFKT